MGRLNFNVYDRNRSTIYVDVGDVLTGIGSSMRLLHFLETLPREWARVGGTPNIQRATSVQTHGGHTTICLTLSAPVELDVHDHIAAWVRVLLEV